MSNQTKLKSNVKGALKDVPKKTVQPSRKSKIPASSQIPENLTEEIQDKKVTSPEIDFIDHVSKNINFFYTDEYENPFVEIRDGERNVKCAVKAGEDFEDFLGKLYWELNNDALPDQVLTKSIKRFKSIAKYDNQKSKGKIAQSVRVARANDSSKIYYCLNNAVEISENGWNVVNEPPYFRRFDHVAEQVYPDKNGNFKKIEEFLNLDNEDEKNLLLVWIVAQFIPDIEKPLLAIHGPQGSAKSTLSSIIRMLVDPSRLMLVTFPTTTNELAQNLYQNYLPVYDNISKISNSQSDTLCRAVTGGGIQKRKLYTDDKTITWSFKRGLIINGIDHVLNRPDLLERSISIKTKRVTGSFKPKEEIFEKYKIDLPEVLGGAFEILTKVLALKATSVPTASRYPRMAEFAQWGFYIAEALEIGGEAFISAYENNINTHNKNVVFENPITLSLIKLLEEEPEKKWNGSMKSLLESLNKVRVSLGHEVTPKGWPLDPSHLSRELNKFMVNLEGIGVYYENKRTNEGAVASIISKIMPSLPSSTDTVIDLTDSTASE
ncbi:MAG: hypothetical protein ACD_59C00056G0004 [uncultured bacterium]|nr:MAG: hypothetical protein ACD_59C00056G0004 [uncultured bacterium]